MSAVEFDSSSDDEGDYKTTSVTLGYVSTEPTGDEVSHIGGHPTWLEDNTLPPAALAKCKVCNGFTSLLLQLNADLQQHFPQDDRRLHVLCCRKKACSKKPGSIRAFREVRKPRRRVQQDDKQARAIQPLEYEPKRDLGTALFGGTNTSASANNSNPFSLPNRSQMQTANPFSSLPPLSSLAAKPPQQPIDNTEPPTSTFAEKLKINSDTSEKETPASESWPDQASFPPPFQYYHLDADTEGLESEPKVQENKGGPSSTKYDAEDTSGSPMDKDTFESSLDKTFQKFSDRVAQNPEQVLRYEYKGLPLLYSGTDSVASHFVVPHGKAGAVRGMPHCETCGAQRVFELQLVPGLIYELEKDEAMELDDGMEWGSIIVGTCAKNCGDAGAISFREEWVGVQWEERVARK